MSHLLRPCPRRGPRFGVSLHGIRAAVEQQFYQFDASPPACPTEWSAFEKVVADIESRASVQERGRKANAFLRRNVFARSRHAMQDCQAESQSPFVSDSSAEIRITTLQDQAEASEIGTAVPVGVVPHRRPVVPDPQRLLKDMKPPYIAARAVHALERHPHDLRIAATCRPP